MTFYSIKADEIATEARVRYNSKNNEIVGTCAPCKDKVDSYVSNSWLNIKEIKDALDSGRLIGYISHIGHIRVFFRKF